MNFEEIGTESCHQIPDLGSHGQSLLLPDARGSAGTFSHFSHSSGGLTWRNLIFDDVKSKYASIIKPRSTE